MPAPQPPTSSLRPAEQPPELPARDKQPRHLAEPRQARGRQAPRTAAEGTAGCSELLQPNHSWRG